MTTATRLTRLELWSALQCAGGRRLAIWPQVIAASMALTLGLDSQLTVQVPLDAEASTALARWTVVRVWESDTAWDEWVITDVTRDDTTGVLTFSAGWPTLLLGRGGLVDERTPDGRVRYELDRVGLTPTTLLDSLVIAPLAAQGLSWVQRGTVTPTGLVDLSLAWQTPLQALTLLAETIPCEIAVRRVGISAYAIDLVERVGVDAPVLDLRRERNLLDFAQVEALSEHATVIVGKGATIDGEAATIAEAVWEVTAVSGAVLTLADPDGGPGPIAYDAQLDGLQLQLPSGATVVITDSTFGTRQVTCATAPTVSVGALVRVRDASGDDLTALPCPPAVTEFGPIVGLLERADLPGHRNLIPNSVLRDWSGAGTVPPDGWVLIGTPTLSRLTSGPQVTRGDAALQVVSTVAGAGVATPLAAITPTADRPFLSGYCTLWVTSGVVRVELVATTGSGEKVYPLGGNLATNRETGVQIDLGLAGVDALTAGITAARLRVVQHSTSGATWVVESAQLTTSAAQLPFVEGSGGNRLWHAVNTQLQAAAVPRLRTTLTFVDLARLLPEVFADDCTVTCGGTARVVLPQRNIDGTARIVRVERNLLRVGDGAITLSDAPQDLTGSLARVTWKPRPIPQPPIIVLAGDVQASTAFDAAGALTILVVGPEGADSLRAAVSTSGMPSAATVDAATGSLRADGVDVAALTAAGPFAAGVVVYIAVRAYRSGVGTRLLLLTDAADAADAAQGPSLEVRQAETSTTVTITYAAIGTLVYRVNDVVTTLPASPITITRPAALSVPIVVTLVCTRNGLVASETITVYPIGVDTVTPDLVVVPVSSGQLSDTVAFTISATDPSGRGLTLTRRMTLTGCSAVGFTGAGPHTLSNGQTVQIVRPLAQNAGVVEFDCLATGGGRAAQQRTVPPRDLTGLGVEVLSNPEFRADLPRPALAYDNGSTGLVTLSYPSVAGQNDSGVVLQIAKAAGAGTNPGAGGFTLNLPRTTAAGFVADAYRSGTVYLITLRANIPIGWTLQWASNATGTGSTLDWLSSQAGTGTWATYVLRLETGSTGSFSSTYFFWLTTGVSDVGAVTWQVARANLRDLRASERQPVASLTARVIAGGDADTAVVQVDITPLSAASRVWLAASTEAPEAGSPALNVEVVSGSTWNMPRRAFRTGVGGAFFLGRTPGFELATASVEIPEQGRDTVPLALAAERVGGTATTEVVRIFATDPFPQGAGTLTLTILPSTASVSPAGPIAMTSGSPVDLTITKPAQTSEPAIVGATLSNANRVSAYLPIKIEPVRALVPARIVFLAGAQSGADYESRFRCYLSDGTELTSTSTALVFFVDERTPASGSPVVVARTITRDTVNGWYRATTPRVAGEAFRALVTVFEQGTTARTDVGATIPTWQSPASGISDAFSSVSLSANTTLNTFVPSFTLAAGLDGASVVASIKRTWGGVDTNVVGVEGTADYTGVISGGGLTPGSFTLVPFASGTTTTYNAQLALAAFIGTTLVGTAFANVAFYVDNTGT